MWIYAVFTWFPGNTLNWRFVHTRFIVDYSWELYTWRSERSRIEHRAGLNHDVAQTSNDSSGCSRAKIPYRAVPHRGKGDSPVCHHIDQHWIKTFHRMRKYYWIEWFPSAKADFHIRTQLQDVSPQWPQPLS